MFRQPGRLELPENRSDSCTVGKTAAGAATRRARDPCLLGLDMWRFIKSLFAGLLGERLPPPRFGLDELSRRLGLDVAELQSVEVAYSPLTIPKRSGGVRQLHVPAAGLMRVQRRIHRRLLRRLHAHANVTGFERGHSIATNALVHAGKDMVIRLDLEDFFGSTKADRVYRYMRFIGYDDASARLLVRLCTYRGALPQGAPTSPRLSNLVNHRLDARLAALAEARGLSYSRYADDITFSARNEDLVAAPPPSGRPGPGRADAPPRPNDIVHAAQRILRDEGYRLHTRRKLRVYRRHHRQMVTGLVVNTRPNLPRPTHRWLRAVEHHLRTGRPATLTPAQLAGWHALQTMIDRQTGRP